jgi:hypothetical protein
MSDNFNCESLEKVGEIYNLKLRFAAVSLPVYMSPPGYLTENSDRGLEIPEHRYVSATEFLMESAPTGASSHGSRFR